MKKFALHIATLITVLFSSQGMSLFWHLCEGELVSVELYEKHSDPCCDEHDKPCGACEDRETQWSIDEYQVSETSITLSLPVLLTPAETFEAGNLPAVAIESLQYTHFNPSPDWSGRQRSILFQSFLL